MKKIMIFFGTFFFLAMIFIAGCKKDDDDDPIIPDPNVSFTPNENTTVPLNGTKMFSWDAKDVLSCYVIRSFHGSNDTLSREKSGSILLDGFTEIGDVYIKVHYVSLRGTPTTESITITVKDYVALLTANLAVSSDTIVVGESDTLFWNHNGDSARITSVPASPPIRSIDTIGSYVVTPTMSTIYTLTVWRGSEVKTASDTIIVTEPTLEYFLTNFGSWKKIKLEFQSAPGEPWVEAEIWECMQDDLITFYLTPTQKTIYDRGEIKCVDTEPRTTEGMWTLNGSILNVGMNYNIEKLTQDTIIWVYHPGGQQDATRETFIHPSKK